MSKFSSRAYLSADVEMDGIAEFLEESLPFQPINDGGLCSSTQGLNTPLSKDRNVIGSIKK